MKFPLIIAAVLLLTGCDENPPVYNQRLVCIMFNNQQFVGPWSSDVFVYNGVGGKSINNEGHESSISIQAGALCHIETR